MIPRKARPAGSPADAPRRRVRAGDLPLAGLLGRWRDTEPLLPTKSLRHDGVLGGIHINQKGIVTLPDGQVRAIVRCQPINMDCLSPESRNKVAYDLSSLVGALSVGQRLQIIVESRPSTAREILPDLLSTMKPSTQDMRDFIGDYTGWLSGQMEHTHLPDLRCFLVIAPPPPDKLAALRGQRNQQSRHAVVGALEQAVEDLSSHLKSMEVPHIRVEKADEVLRILWDSLHHANNDACPPLQEFYPDEGMLDGMSDELRGRPEALAEVQGYWLQRCLFDLSVREVQDCLHFPSVSHQQMGERRQRRGADAPSGGLGEGPAPARMARSIYLIAPPEITWAGYLEPILSLECPYRISVHLEGLSKVAERRKLKTRRRALANISRGQKMRGKTVDVDAESAEEEVDALARETLDPTVSIAKMGLYITVFADDPENLRKYADRVRNVLISRLGATMGHAIGHQLPLWRATLPFCVDIANRRYRVVSQTVGDGFPFLTHNPGTSRGMALGFTPKGRELVRFDPADPSLPNSLMNIVGRSGSGKTFLANKMILHTLLCGGRATVVDRAGHYETLVRAFGGQAVRLVQRDTPMINPWDYDFSRVEQKDLVGALSQKIAFVVDAHEILLTQAGGVSLTRMERGLLEAGVRAVYARHVPLGTIPRERDLYRWIGLRIGDLGVTRELGDDPPPTEDDNEKAIYREMHVGISSYVHDGTNAYLVDRHTGVNLDCPLLVFDIKGLQGNMNALAMFVISEAVNRRATKERRAGEAATSVRELLVIDEGWFLIKYGGAAAWIETLARQGRHLGLFLLFISQQISDLLVNETAVALFNAASVQFLYRQRDARGKSGKSSIEELAEVLSLTKREATELTRLTSKPGYYSEMLLLRESKDEGSYKRGVVRVMPNPHEYWLFTSDAMRDVPRRNEMILACGGDVDPGPGPVWLAIRRLAKNLPLPQPGEITVGRQVRASTPAPVPAAGVARPLSLGTPRPLPLAAPRPLAAGRRAGEDRDPGGRAEEDRAG